MIQKSNYKFILQKYEYDCGVAAVTTLLLNSGAETINYINLGKRLKVSKGGTDFDKITDFLLSKKNLEPMVFYGATIFDLQKELKQGRLALILYQGWGNAVENAKLQSGHYAVVVGYENKKVYLLDPSVYEDWGDGIGWRILDQDKFQKRWIDKEKNKLIRGWMVSVKTPKT